MQTGNTIIEIANPNLDRVKRYGWTVKDAPGQMQWIEKHALSVERAYQRHLDEKKMRGIAAEWSWFACGAILVASRGGEQWVVDGQHRVAAAMHRRDISALPCLVFESESIQQEARAFIDSNSRRRPIPTVDKFRALVVSGDEVAAFAADTMDRLGIVATKTATGPRQIKSLSWVLRMAAEDRESFVATMETCAELCSASPVPERLLQGVNYLHRNIAGGVREKRLRERLRVIGAVTLVHAAHKAAAFFSKGGSKIFATGMLEEINRGLRTKFEFRDGADAG